MHIRCSTTLIIGNLIFPGMNRASEGKVGDVCSNIVDSCSYAKPVRGRLSRITKMLTTILSITEEKIVNHRRKDCVTRDQYLSPDRGELWYLRSGHIVSRHALRSPYSAHPTQRPSLETTARHLGLVHGLEEYIIAFQEALHFSIPLELRKLFITFILAGAPVRSLSDDHHEYMIADSRHKMSAEAATLATLRSIDLRLHKHGKSTIAKGLPAITHETTENDRLTAAFDPDQMFAEAAEVIPKLTSEQLTVVDTVVLAASKNTGGIYMMDAPAVTGKTFTEFVIAEKLRLEKNFVLIDAPAGTGKTFR